MELHMIDCVDHPSLVSRLLLLLPQTLGHAKEPNEIGYDKLFSLPWKRHMTVVLCLSVESPRNISNRQSRPFRRVSALIDPSLYDVIIVQLLFLSPRFFLPQLLYIMNHRHQLLWLNWQRCTQISTHQ